MAFAKLFESVKYGQILAKIDTGEEGNPEVRFYVEPENLGVCSIAQKFRDTDAGWDNAEALFEKVDLAVAELHIENIYKNLP